MFNTRQNSWRLRLRPRLPGGAYSASRPPSWWEGGSLPRLKAPPPLLALGVSSFGPVASWQGNGCLPNFFACRKFSPCRKIFLENSIVRKESFTLKFRKPGWTEQSKLYIWVYFEFNLFRPMQTDVLYDYLTKFQIIFLHTHAIRDFQLKVIDAFNTNFALGSL